MASDDTLHSEAAESAEALQRSELRFRAIIEGFRDPILIIDAHRLVRYVNTAFTRVLGHPPAAVLARRFEEILHPDDAAGVLVHLAPRPGAQGAPAVLEHRVRRADGGWEIAETAVSELLDPVGRPALVLHVHCITDRRAMESQLIQSQKMETLGRLAGGIAHDFNNLLTVILGTVDVSLTELPDEPSMRAALETIRSAAVRATSLTHQLLAFSRKQILKPAVVSLDAVVRDLEPMLRRLIGEHITVRVEAAPEPWRVRVDPSQMDQVLLNLAVNARDAMPGGGTLTIRIENVLLGESYSIESRAALLGPHVVLSVEDTGTGMDQATLEKIFEPFFTTKSPGRGSGLGLATVYGIVKQSGGEILCESTVGAGTRFQIHLPRAEEPLQASSPPPAPASAEGRETILVVDDDEALCTVAKRILEKSGYTVLLASSGEEALRLMALHGDRIALILTDVVMPGMSGPELVARLRQEHPATKVLFTTGYTADMIAEENLLDDASRFLVKPYSVRTLPGAVRRALDS